MLNHYRGTGGYALLYLMIVFGIILLTLLAVGIASSVLGLQNAGQMAGGVILATFWIVGFIVMKRFVAIENRRPTIAESNIIGIKSVLYVFAVIFSLALLVMIVVFLVKLIGGGGGAKTVGQTSNSEGPNQQAIGALWAVVATMFLLYIAPFFNMAILSRLVSPVSNEVNGRL